MKKREFEALLREAVQLDAEAQGRRMQLETPFVPVPDESRRRFLAALNGGSHAKRSAAPSEPFEAEPETESRTPSPMRERARRILITVLSVGAGAAAAAALLIVVVLPFLRDGGSRKPADAIDTPPTAAASALPYGELEPTVPADAPDPIELPEHPYDPDSLEGEWTSYDGEGGKPSTLVIDRDGTATVTGLQSDDGGVKTYAVTEQDGGLYLTSESETLLLARDLSADALLVMRPDFVCTVFYRDLDARADMFSSVPAAPAIAETDAFCGVWALDRVETGFAVFDLSALSGHLTVGRTDARCAVRLCGKADPNAHVYTAADSILSFAADNAVLTGGRDAQTGELRLSVLYDGQTPTGAEPALVFSPVPGVTEPLDRWTICGTWDGIDGQLYAEGWTMTLRVNAIGYATLEAQHDGVTEQKEGYLNSTSWLYTVQLNGKRDVFGMFSRFGFDTVSGTLRMVNMDQLHIEDDDLSMTRMVFCRRTDENGDAIPPEGLTEIPLSELDGHWLPTGGKWATKYPYIEMTFSSSADEVEWRLVNEQLWYDKKVPRWETREYLIDGDAIRLYRTGKEVQFFLHPTYGAVYYTNTWGDMTLRYDRENHTIHIVQHDVDLYILEKEKTPEPTPAPFGETP